ncbi:MAG: DUF2892 domain-containing protein [Ignavibacteria bacterium]|jgi:hypothetical protein|nr:DUF2892 domain-containing protein [Ignavibacteria bacterium]
MKKNVGTIDKAVRIIVGLGLIGYALYSGVWWGYLGIIPLLTAFMGTCPAYIPFGISTCEVDTKK